MPCHLHTSDPANIAYYGRFGFEVSQPAIEVFAHGPHYIGMTRPPHGDSAQDTQRTFLHHLSHLAPKDLGRSRIYFLTMRITPEKVTQKSNTHPFRTGQPEP